MDNDSKRVLATLVGVASGVVIGLLLAPEEGKKTRQKIGKKGEDYLDEIKKELEELRKNINKKTHDAKNELNNYSKDAKKQGEELLKKAKKLTSLDEWTKDELYQRAKEKAIEGYPQMNKDELIEALRNN